MNHTRIILGIFFHRLKYYDSHMIHRLVKMVAEDWASCKIPLLMAQAIDEFVKTDIAKKNGVFSRSEFVTRVIASWFSKFEKDFGIFVPRDVIRNGKYVFTKPFD